MQGSLFSNDVFIIVCIQFNYYILFDSISIFSLVSMRIKFIPK